LREAGLKAGILSELCPTSDIKAEITVGWRKGMLIMALAKDKYKNYMRCCTDRNAISSPFFDCHFC